MKDWKTTLLRHERWLSWAIVTAPLLAWVVSRWLGRGPKFHAAWVLVPVAALLVLKLWCRWQRERAVREAPLPMLLRRKLREQYPHLSGKDADLVTRGLRQFFVACLRANGKFVAMPSRVVDAMWHEFILHTRAYGEWCDLTVGRFVHHTPALALGSVAKHNDGLRRAWFWACRDEGIDPRLPTRLPLLFALDGKLGIAGGFRYQTGFLPARAAQPGDSGEANYGSSFSDGSYPGESLDAADFGGSDSGATGGADGDGDGSGGCGGD